MRKIKIESTNMDEAEKIVSDLNLGFQNSTCFKGIHEDIIVFYCGICRLTETIGEVWIHILDKSFVETPRVITNLIDGHFDLGYDRIQSTAYASDLISDRWMKYHGFQLEGTLRLFGPNGEDMNVYSKLREGVWQQGQY
jgi:RimJ/RimL family protein N-acetyltransferase